MTSTELATAFRSKKPADIRAAHDALAKMPREAATDLLVDVLLNEQRKRARFDRIGTCVTWAVLVSWVAGGILFFVVLPWQQGRSWPRMAWQMLTFMIGPAHSLLFSRKDWPAQRNAAVALARLESLHAVGPLLDSMRGAAPSPEEAGTVMQALTRLLPRMGPDQAYVINRRQRRTLHNLLSSQYRRLCVGFRNGKFLYDGPVGDFSDDETACYVAMITALEQTGDKDAAQVLRQIAEGETETSNHVRVAEAARAALARSQTRMAQNLTHG